MPSNLKFAATLKNAMQNVITTQAGTSAIIEIYSGSQPASPDAVNTGTLLATLTCSATLAPAASGGVLTLNAITSGTGTAGAGAGTNATCFRLKVAANAGASGLGIVDGSVAISGADLNINNTNIATGQTVAVTSFTFTNAQ